MFKDKIIKLLDLALDISNNSEDDVFVEYSPHCQLVSVRVYFDGWSRRKCDLEWDVYFDITEFRSEDIINSKFDEILVELKSRAALHCC